LANQIEAFTIALANLGIAIVQRTERFSSLYFTKVDYGEFFPAGSKGLPISDSFVAIDLWQELSSLVAPTIPTGIGMFECVEDLQANTRIKVGKARRAVELCVDLLGQNLLSATTWMDLRKRQDPGRILGRPAAEALTCFRQMVPLVNPPNLPSQPLGEVAVEFMRTNKARRFVPLFLPDNPET
jgi:histidine ammonia-lyase